MKKLDFSLAEQSVLNVIQKEPLTSFQILKRVETIPVILTLYNVMDRLKSNGLLKSFVNNNVKYYYAA
ncbi:hypothetical protein [uncultured Polaribacter sp.]|uniref:hypothetical protein n=1 Tax=uncultured Polaribacter sp. TaxID=174711 RepID=UPI002616A852|nr:hypothetical protein [uncultured Polaribacter sp.]